MKQKLKKCLALFLSAAMAFTMLPASAAKAEDAAGGTEPILHWDMTTNADGTLKDLSGGGHSGAITQPAALKEVEGINVLDLTGGYVDIPDGTIGTGDTELTINMLVKITENIPASWMWCLGTNNTKYMYFTGCCSANQGSVMRGGVGNGSPGYSHESVIIGDEALEAEQWQNVTVTYKDGGDFIFYNNGVLQKSTNLAGGSAGTFTLQDLMTAGDARDGYMGWSFYTGNDPKFQGAVADFRIYNHAMDAEEVTELQKEIDMKLASLKFNDFAVKDVDLKENDCLGETNASKDAVTADLALPAKTTITIEDMTVDADITGWKSSNTAVISESGKVVPGVFDETVTLTASVKYKEKTVEKPLTFKVIGAATDEQIAEAVAEAIEIPNADDIRGSITLPTTGSIEGSAIAWASSDEGVITSQDEGQILAGLVHRQDQDTKVLLTATVTYKEAKAVRTITCTVKKKAETPELTDYLFAYFPYTSTKDERIYFGTSRDGLNFAALNNSKFVLESTLGTHGLRDPFIIRSHEGDKFYLIATDLTVAGITQNGESYPGQSWNQNQTNGSQSIMVWESNDLVNWSDQRMCKVAVDDAGCAWAPEAYWADELQQYVVFWASKAEAIDNYTNQRVYYATTRDFRTFSKAQVWIEEAGSVIDTTVIKVGEYYYRYTKNEAGTANRYGTPSKRVYCERSTELTSKDWEFVHKNSLDVSGGQIEGPCIFKLNSDDVEHAKQIASLKGFTLEGDDVYCLAADKTGSTIFPGLSTDITTGSFHVLGTGKAETVDGTLLYSMPEPDASHGTIMPVTTQEYNNLMLKYDTAYAEAAAAVIAKAEAAADKLTLDVSSPITDDLTLPTLEEDDVQLTWKSSNESVLAADGTVSRPPYENGDAVVTLTAVVTAVGNETVTDQIVTKDFAITVAKKDPIAVTDLTLKQTAISLKTGETAELEAVIEPAEASDKTVTWKSSDAAVASVSDGIITAHKAGTATITAVSSNGIEAKCEVTVTQDAAAVTDITLSQKALALKTGQTAALTATVVPENAADKTITWSSSDVSIASVANGTVTAVKAGTATITASAANGVKAECQITVTEEQKKPDDSTNTETPKEETKITLSKKSVTLGAKESVTLKASVTPAGIKQTIKWTSSKTSVATVKNGKITAKKKGTATITAAVGGKTAVCKVTVKAAPSKLTLNKKSITLRKGKTFQIKVKKMNPKNTLCTKFKYTSKKSKIAKVSSKGKITAVKKGTTTITVTCGNNKKAKASIKVKVK